MREEIFIALIIKAVEDEVSKTLAHGRMGPRGFQGPKGEDGKGFDFKEHEEKIRAFSKEFALKFSDLTEQEILSLTGPRGEKGRDGRDGKDGLDFNFENHREFIENKIKENSLKFSDLSIEEVESLRGPRGRDGKDGPRGEDGKGFDFSEHQDAIAQTLQNYISSIKDELKLKFSDLSLEESESLRGPRGRDGKDGKSFVFDEHAEFFNSLKFKFSDFTADELDSFKLKFSSLTEEEKDSLKLKFSDLKEDERILLRGPRGMRGQKGAPGTSAKWLSGEGPPAIVGDRGEMYTDVLTGDVYRWE